MTHKEQVAEALRTMDFYKLAKLTMEEHDMKIKVKHVNSKEELTRCGNRFFTKEQLAEIARA